MKTIRLFKLSAIALLSSLTSVALAIHPICNHSGSDTLQVTVGQTLTFTMEVDDTAGSAIDQPVKLILDVAQTLPAGVTLTPALGTFFTPPLYGSYTFSWTPTASQVGIHNLTFHAVDIDGNMDGGLGAPNEPCTFTITVLPENTPTVTPFTQGYWKNHPANWPVSTLTLGTKTYTKAQLLAIFRTPPRGDASLILAHQLIAALLNYANGADASLPDVNAAITDAQTLLGGFAGRLPYGVKASSATGQSMILAARVLNEYNNL